MQHTPAALKRPRTSTPRGICRYYTSELGCYAGSTCKFLHCTQQEADADQPLLTPYDRAKRCVFYAKGYCKREENCWFKHELPPPLDVIAVSSQCASGLDEPEACGICLEIPVTYGLLESCNHVFCIHCIRQWRKKNVDEYDLAASKEKCPMCRISSKFVAPSSRFYASSAAKQGGPFAASSSSSIPTAGGDSGPFINVPSSNDFLSTTLAPSRSASTSTHCQLSPSAPVFIPSAPHSQFVGVNINASSSSSSAAPPAVPSILENRDDLMRPQLQSKAQIIASYKASMKRIPCRHFLASSRRSCKFRNNCFYQHVDADGNEVVFPTRVGTRAFAGRGDTGVIRPSFVESFRNGLVQFLMGMDNTRSGAFSAGTARAPRPAPGGPAAPPVAQRGEVPVASQPTTDSTEDTIPGAASPTRVEDATPAGDSQALQDMSHVSDEDIDAVLHMLHNFQEDLSAYRDNIGEVAGRIEDEQLNFDDFDMLNFPELEREEVPSGEMLVDLDLYNHDESSRSRTTQVHDGHHEEPTVVPGVEPQSGSTSHDSTEGGVDVSGQEESSTLNRTSSTSPPLPPFLTDGRGRVVWSGSANGDGNR